MITTVAIVVGVGVVIFALAVFIGHFIAFGTREIDPELKQPVPFRRD